jgi:uncharacterized cupredoxin-like copper-binding protein
MHKTYFSLIAVVVFAAILYFASVTVLVYRMQPPLISNSDVFNKKPTMNILLYEGEISSSRFGFGYTPDTLSSPGPTLEFKTSDVVNITVVNIGSLPHAFAITNIPQTGATTLFKAQIGSVDNPLQPDQSGSVIFQANNAGSAFFYICPLPGSAEAGMYGAVVITTVSDNGTEMVM